MASFTEKYVILIGCFEANFWGEQRGKLLREQLFLFSQSFVMSDKNNDWLLNKIYQKIKKLSWSEQKDAKT